MILINLLSATNHPEAQMIEQRNLLIPFLTEVRLKKCEQSCDLKISELRWRSSVRREQERFVFVEYDYGVKNTKHPTGGHFAFVAKGRR